MAKKETPPSVPSARNRKVLRDYFIEERIEAGIVLTGTEVKSLRLGRANINEAFAREAGGEIWLEGAHIPHYNPAGQDNHEPNRSRKLLLHRRQIARMIGQINRSGYTLVPIALFFNARGMAKVEIGLGKGKHTYDKRQAVKDRDWKRQKERLMRDRG